MVIAAFQFDARIAFLILVMVLIFRPSGLLGAASVEEKL